MPKKTEIDKGIERLTKGVSDSHLAFEVVDKFEDIKLNEGEKFKEIRKIDGKFHVTKTRGG
jgi:hypothetical protein